MVIIFKVLKKTRFLQVVFLRLVVRVTVKGPENNYKRSGVKRKFNYFPILGWLI